MRFKLDFEEGVFSVDTCGPELRAAVHAVGRDTQIRASYLPGSAGHDDSDREPGYRRTARSEFISASVTIRGDDGTFSRKSVQAFLSIEQACELRDELDEAIKQATPLPNWPIQA